jgi:hypothetical protein
MLSKLGERLTPGGRLFIQVNDVDRTPFDLLVADHLCHFTPRSLACLVARAGLGVEAVHTDWVKKEISLLAGVDPQPLELAHDDPRGVIPRIEADVAWLQGMLGHARESASGGRFGIFGTSVGATWLASGLGDAVEFFVDEDPAREGRSHLDRPILRPEQVPPGAVVYLAFVREVSSAISRRLADLPVTFAVPPARAASD